MKKIMIFYLFLFSLYTAKGNTQIDFKPFEEFSGKWEGIYEIEGTRNKEILENKFIHKNMFFEMNIRGQMEGNSSYKYTSSAVFTVGEKEEIVGWGFDEDGYKGIVQYKGKIDGNKVVLKGKSRDYSVELSYEVISGKLIRKSKWIFSDSPDKPSVVECVYKKI